MREMHARGRGIGALSLLLALTAGAQAASVVVSMPQAQVDSPLSRAAAKVQLYYYAPNTIGTRPPTRPTLSPSPPTRRAPRPPMVPSRPPAATPLRTPDVGGSNLGTFNII